MKAKDHPKEIKDLRRQAEAEIRAEASEPEAMSPEDCVRLIHELRVHQVELEMQNEELRRVQTELDESLDQYADLYDFAPVGYLTLNKESRILATNQTAASLLGVDPVRLLNYHFGHFLAPADRQPFQGLLAEILQQQQQQQQQVHLQDTKGQWHDFLLDLNYDWSVEDRQQVRVTMTDITELTRAQEELRLHKEDLEKLVTERTSELAAANEHLRQVNEELEALFQAAPLAIGVFDKQGRVVSANPAAERMFDWPLAETLGRVAPTLPPDDRESRELLQRVLRGESLTGVERNNNARTAAVLRRRFR